jgi:hypothetical protein
LRFPLTEQLLEEAKAFELRAACRDCFFWNGKQGECWHGWPDEGQRQWPLAAPPSAVNAAATEATATAACDAEPAVGSEVAFCKEFELK